MEPEEDPDQPPATLDAAVQDVLDFNYRAISENLQDARQLLHQIYPDLLEHLPETAHDHLSTCLDEIVRATRHLNKAGKFIIGQAEYDAYIDAQVRRQLER